MEDFIQYWESKQNNLDVVNQKYSKAKQWFSIEYSNVERSILKVCRGKISPEVKKSIKLLRKSFEKLENYFGD